MESHSKVRSPHNPFNPKHLSADEIKQWLCLTAFHILSVLLHMTFEATELYSTLMKAWICDFLCKYGRQSSVANSFQCNNSHKVLQSVYSYKSLQVQPSLYIKKSLHYQLREGQSTLLRTGPALIQEQNRALRPFCTFDWWGGKNGTAEE